MASIQTKMENKGRPTDVNPGLPGKEMYGNHDSQEISTGNSDQKSIRSTISNQKEPKNSTFGSQNIVREGPGSKPLTVQTLSHDQNRSLANHSPASPQSKPSPANLNEFHTDDSSWKDASLTIDSSTVNESEEEEIESEFEEEAENESTISRHSDEENEEVEPPVSPRLTHVQFEVTPESADEIDLSSEESYHRSPSFTERKRRFSFFQSTCFNDQIRPIDMVLSYIINDSKKKKKSAIHAEYREKFEAALIDQGFQLEHARPENSFDAKTGFVKIHAPFSVLERQAELRSLQKPFMESDIDPPKPSWWKKLSKKCCGKDPFALQDIYKRPRKEYFTDVFDRDRKQDFVNSDDELAFFTEAQRIYLTWDAISSTTINMHKNGENEPPPNGGSMPINGPNGKMTQNGPGHPPMTNGEKKMETNLNIDRDQETDQENDHGDHEQETDQKNGRDHDQETDQEIDHDDHDQGDGNRAEDPQAPIPSDEKLSDDADEDSVLGRDKPVNFHFLVQMGVYKSAYPLHDSNLDDDPEITSQPVTDWPLRKYLYESWARPRQWRRYQPLHVVREYYGEKVGIYFAWIGFYTKMLIIPSILGVLVTIYGLISIYFNNFSYTICEDSAAANITLCPDCPTEACPYTKLRSYCNMSRIAAAFDNPLTVFFSVFMAIWAVCFLEFWKRYRSQLCVDWDVTDEEFDTEPVRPEYALRAPDVKMNPITKQMEPHLKTSTRLKRVFASLATVLFFILVVIGLLAGVMVYKVVGPTWWKMWLKDKHANENDKGEGNKELQEYALIVSITSSLANGIFIAIMTQVYMAVAWYLTQAEFPRTDKEFEYSYTYKVFIFQCVNFYGALFYLAIIRGRVSVPPHQQNYETRCPVSGCIVDVSIQLAVIFVGKQAINNIIELGLPLIKALIKKCKRHRRKHQNPLPTWERDFQLNDPQRILLFSDYLELLIQYGFTTMFVAAFPLAPLFAFLNNVIEIRLDAYKNLVLTQRSMPLRAKNIGPWFNLLVIVTRLAVITNALVIAFTTQFIDRLLFRFIERAEWLMAHHVGDPRESFLYFTLSEFNVSDAEKGGPQYVTHLMGGPVVETGGTLNLTHVEQCYYVDYRHASNDLEEPYGRNTIWWHVLAARLIFVILFEHFVFLFQSILANLIPDVSRRDRMRIAREQHLIKSNFMEREFGGAKKRMGNIFVEESDDDEEFVPDELPDWITGATPAVSTVEGTASQMRRHPGNGTRSLHSEGTQDRVMSRGKVIVRKAPKKRRPFFMVLLKKLMFCE